MIVKKLLDDQPFQLGVIGTGLTLSTQSINDYISIFCGLLTALYLILKCLQLLRNDEKSKKD
jgi:hypothetical protein